MSDEQISQSAKGRAGPGKEGANQHSALSWTAPQDLEVGRQADVPIRLASRTIVIRCRVIDFRTSFGRREWRIAPISGRGDAWVQEKSFLNDGSPTAGPAVRDRHPDTDYEKWAAEQEEASARRRVEEQERMKREAEEADALQANASEAAPGFATRQVRRGT